MKNGTFEEVQATELQSVEGGWLPLILAAAVAFDVGFIGCMALCPTGLE